MRERPNALCERFVAPVRDAFTPPRGGVLEPPGGAASLGLSTAPEVEATLEAVVVKRPPVSEDEEAEQHLCLDKAYDKVTGYAACQRHDYVAHFRRIGEEKFDENKEKKHPARRWVVERTFAWLASCRAILVRYDKRGDCYLALVKLACTLLWFRRLFRLERQEAAQTA